MKKQLRLASLVAGMAIIAAACGRREPPRTGSPAAPPSAAPAIRGAGLGAARRPGRRGHPVALVGRAAARPAPSTRSSTRSGPRTRNSRSTSSSSRSADIFTKWRTDVAAGGGPDMFIAPNDRPGPGRPRGVIADLDECSPATARGLPAGRGRRLEGRRQVLHGPRVAQGRRPVVRQGRRSPPPRPRPTRSSPASRTARSSSASTRASTTTSAGRAPSAARSWTTPASASPTRAASPRRTSTSVAQGRRREVLHRRQRHASGLPDRHDQRDRRRPVADRRTSRRALGDKLAVAPIPAGPSGPANPLTGADGWYINPNRARPVELAVDVALALTAPAASRSSSTTPATSRPTRRDHHRPDHPGLRRRCGRRPAPPAERPARQLLGQLRRRPQQGPRHGRRSGDGGRGRVRRDERGERPLALARSRTGAPTGRPVVPIPCRRLAGAHRDRMPDDSETAMRRAGSTRPRSPAQPTAPARSGAARPAVPVPGAGVHRDGRSSRSTRWSSRSGCRSRTSAR